MFGWEPPLDEQNSMLAQAAIPNASAANVTTAPKKPKKGLTQLPPDFIPTNYSVILGRGKGSYNYVGNKRCRVIVKSFLDEYNKCNTRQERSVIVSKVLGIIEEACPIGGFIKQDSGSWYTVDEKIAREKIFTMFRDCQNSQSSRSSSSSVKSMMRSSRSSSPHKLTSILVNETGQQRLPINFPAPEPELSNSNQPSNNIAFPKLEESQRPSIVDVFEPIKFEDDDESLGESLGTAGSFYDVDSCSFCTI